MGVELGRFVAKVNMALTYINKLRQAITYDKRRHAGLSRFSYTPLYSLVRDNSDNAASASTRSDL